MTEQIFEKSCKLVVVKEGFGREEKESLLIIIASIHTFVASFIKIAVESFILEEGVSYIYYKKFIIIYILL